MKIIEPARSERMSLVSSAVVRAVRLLLFGLIGWFLFISKADFVSRAASLVAILALAALAGIMWYSFRARAETRLRSALDAYAKQEQAKEED
jgi:hypothetical protein